MQHPIWKQSCAAAAIVSLLTPAAGIAQHIPPNRIPNTAVDIAPPSSPAVARYTLPPTASASDITYAQEVALLRQKVKYVFVLFQENRSFDFYFGTYPGAHGLFSQPQRDTLGFNQPLVAHRRLRRQDLTFSYPPERHRYQRQAGAALPGGH